MSQNRTIITWSLLLLLLAASFLLMGCSGDDQLLLAEYNRNGEAEIFLAEVGADEAEWQSLAEDVQRTYIFEGDLAMFVPDSDRILLWYQDGNDVRIEQLRIGDEAPTELLEINADARLFASFETDPFTIYATESRDFVSYRCYVAQDGAEAVRLARGELCFMNGNGVVELDIDPDDGTTVTLISLDGEEETVILDEVEEVGARVRYNEALTRFAYAESNNDKEQLFLIEPGDEAGEPLGEAFARIDAFGFLGDGETVFVVGKRDEADDEVGLFVNAAGDALIEADNVRQLGQAEDGEYVIFEAESRGETAVFIHNLDDNTVTELLEEASVTLQGFATEDQFLLKTANEDEEALYSVRQDGSEMTQLLATNDYEILSVFMNQAAEQLLIQLRDEDDNDAIYVSSLNEENGYFLVEDWYVLSILNASEDLVIFWGREDAGDDPVLYSIAWAEGASEIELDDNADFGFYNVFFAKDGRSLYYTANDKGFGDFEVRQVPVDGSERPQDLYRDMVLLDVSWEEESNLQQVK